MMPYYIVLQQARKVLAEIGVQLNPRQMKRAADKDAQGRCKLPFFVDPIEGKKVKRVPLCRFIGICKNRLKTMQKTESK